MEIKRVYDFPGNRQAGYVLCCIMRNWSRLALNVPGIRRIRLLYDVRTELPDPSEMPGKCRNDLDRADPIRREGDRAAGNFEGGSAGPVFSWAENEGKTNIGCILLGKKDGVRGKLYICHNVCDHEASYREVGSQAVAYTTAYRR